MRKIADFLRDEHGSYTIEFCLWIPVFLFFLAATIDASVLYLTHTEMWNVARDTARRVTTGELATPDDAMQHLANTVLLSKGYVFEVPDWSATDEVTVGVYAPIGGEDGASIFGIFGFVDWWYGYSGDAGILDSWLAAEVTMRLEPDFS